MGRRRSKWKDRADESDPGAALLQCARAGVVADLEALLARLQLPDAERRDLLQRAQDHTGATALHLAAAEGHCEMARRLLALGAGELHQRKAYARTPLHEAAMNGHADVCRLLVHDGGLLVDCHTTRGRTPLMYAVKGNHEAAARVLLDECGANVNEQNEMGVTPVYLASQEGLAPLVALLVARGADVNVCNRTRHSPLHEAVAGGHVAVAALLLAHGAAAHAVDAMGVTIWHEAAGNGAVALLELLVDHGVALPSGQVDKVMARHPFHYAAVEGRAAFVRALLARRLVDVNLVDADGCSAVYYAAANGHADVLRELLARGADPNVASVRRAPLHCATEWRRAECVALLLAHGARADEVDTSGSTALDIARAKGFEEIERLLLARP
ncbi:hypothetical protein PybrP1_005581 [[Pythium] brassicae (nom. inval.)]|nr:hypothetical protein PybrP1_005581 [[Pythium] brassicae (nom. inval.)]